MLAVFLLSIVSVSASETDNTIASEDTDSIELSADNDIIGDNLQTNDENDDLTLTGNDDTLSVKNDTEVLGDNPGTYSGLSSEIGSGGNITLQHDYYTYDTGNTIKITIDGIIDGKGAVIDMAGAGPYIHAFEVSVSGVTIKNLTIKNANYNYGGSAIYFSGNGTVTNCNFISNNAGSYGAVFFSDGAGTVTNCNFIGNNATTYGAAVSFYDNGTVTNCNFIGNNATNSGGAVYFSGNGAVSNCNFTNNSAKNGGAVYFSGNGTVSNCNFVNNTASSNGGSVALFRYGTMSNCNFTGNTADDGGAVYAYGYGNGTVLNCNFAGNTASDDGGAVYFYCFKGNGTVLNCNFAGNTASDDGGAVYFDGYNGNGDVLNCNFTGNTASDDGGAVYFYNNGNLTNCNFAGNAAKEGGAIYAYKSVVADTCIFKKSSDTTNRTNILPPVLNVDNFTTCYGSEDKLTFNLTTNSSIPVTNGNISISIYFKDNNSWVGNYSCLSGEGWTPELPVESYYAIFNTEYAGFQPINRTITITIPSVQYYINVTSLASYNKTVNITVKSDIPKNILWDGKLQLILPNGTRIDATYGANGTWWAEHTFNNCSEFKVSAAYVGLDNVAVNNGTITINKVNSTITLDNIVFDYGDSNNVTVATTGATGITAKIADDDADVDEFVISIPVLDVGNYTLTVTTIPDDDHNSVTKTVNITVNKANSTLTVDDIVFDYGSSASTIVSFTGADGFNASVVGQPDTVVKVNGTNITVSGLNAGTYILTVTAIGDVNHNNITKNATITVNKLKTELTGSEITTTYNVNKDLVITLKDSTGKVLSGVELTVVLNGAKTYTTDSNGQVKVTTQGLASKVYSAKVTFNGNTNYDGSTKDIKVTVNKAANPLNVKAKTVKVKFSKLKKKAQNLKVTQVVKFTNKGQGTLTYNKVNGNNKITINKKTGKVTIKKGLKKGTYKVKMKIKAKGNTNYKASAFKTITFKIKVN